MALSLDSATYYQFVKVLRISAVIRKRNGAISLVVCQVDFYVKLKCFITQAVVQPVLFDGINISENIF